MHRWVIVLLSLSAIRAGDGPLDRATLRGIKALSVIVDRLDADLEQAGLTQNALRARLEGRLKNAGVPVDPKAVEFVGLRVNSFLAKKGPDSLCFSLGFYQPVVLARDQKVRTASPTWEVQTMLLVPPKPMVQSALNTADQVADQFISAYQAANPK
ncbi:MAG: hypothetical protein C5B51_11320 [Terriglobia bacterium]|nr:MAG: hypothetical protein C5B51_11320 [Terriglobia bacterium]